MQAEQCHMKDCENNADFQLRVKQSDGDVVIPMCENHAREVVANRKDYELYDDSTIEIDLKKSMTITRRIFRFKKKV